MRQLRATSGLRCFVKHDPALRRPLYLGNTKFAYLYILTRPHAAVGASAGQEQGASTAVTHNTQQAAHQEAASELIFQPSDQSSHASAYCYGRTQAAPSTNCVSAFAPNPFDRGSQRAPQEQQLHQHHHEHQEHQQQNPASGRSGHAYRLFVNPLRLVFGKAWRKAVPLSILFFASTFIFTLLQSLKDGIVVMNMGADALPFLATFGTLPASLAFFSLYRSLLVPNVPPQHLFYATAAPFLAFYALFAVVLFPLAPTLQNPSWLAFLPEVLPPGLRGLAAMLQYWLYSLFFVAGDLWGPVMISLAFWTVADEVCTMEEAGQLYPQLGLLANLGLVGSGRFIKAVHCAIGGQGGAAGMGAVLQVLVACILATSVVMFICKMEINKRHLDIRLHMQHQQQQQQLKQAQHRQNSDQQHVHQIQQKQQQHAHQQHPRQQKVLFRQQLVHRIQQQRQQQKDPDHCRREHNGHEAQLQAADATSDSNKPYSVRQRWQSSDSQQNHNQQQEQEHHQHTASISRPGSSASTVAAVHSQKASWSEVASILQHNTTAAALATTVVGFSVSYRMYEYSYKAQLQLASADSVAYCCKLAEVQSAVGIATICMMLASRFIFKHFGWSTAAVISPYSMLLSGTAFFGCSLFAQAAAASTPAAAVAAATSCSASSIATQSAASSNVPAAAVQLLHRSVDWLSSSVGHYVMPGQDWMWLGLAAGFATALASCACHNSLFTPCKQMVYKTLPAHQLEESKAAVDLVGGQFAKSAAGWLVQLLLLSFGNITAALPACFVIFVTSILAWLNATSHLSQQMKAHETKLVQQTESASQDVGSVQQQQHLPHIVAGDHQQRLGEVLVKQQQQMHVALDWQLPLPCQLAVAAAGAKKWPQDVLQPAAANLGLAAEAAGTHSMLVDRAASSLVGSSSSGSCSREFAAVQAAQHMYTDAGYWDCIYAALADNPHLLESVMAGLSIEASSSRPREDQRVEQQQQQVATSSQSGLIKPVRYVQQEKQALHTLFDIDAL